MNCREFKELSDSYLSNELLIETNHSMIHHLESCANCREELAQVRTHRQQLISAVHNEDGSKIDPMFSVKLKAALRSQGIQRGTSYSSFIRFAFAGVLGALLVGISASLLQERPPQLDVVLNPKGANVANSNNSDRSESPASFERVRNDALDDHKDCALSHRLEERPIKLSEASVRYDIAYRDIERTVVDALESKFGNELKLLRAHYCLINGRAFAHMIVEHEKKIVSVLMTRGEANGNNERHAPTDCGNEGPIKVACFRAERFDVFVISELGSEANLSIADSIAEPVADHVRSSGQPV